jgi:DNA-binding Lrp family transcriptional regulator
MRAPCLSLEERRMLNDWQRGLPLVARPFAAIAGRLGLSEEKVIETIARLKKDGVLARVGAVVRPNTVGASTLAALAVPPERLDEVAAIVSAQPEVNHNYEREHRFNLWFVVTAEDRKAVEAALTRIAHATGLDILDLPLAAEYRIDLGFDLAWT